MNILGVETSCDETAVAIVRDGHEVLANSVASQIKLHAGYGGVVPELAAREHLKAMRPVADAALEQASLRVEEIDAVAVTCGPGLVPALLVGGAYAKGLAAALGRPFFGINHFLAHIYGAFLGRPGIIASAENFPLLALVVSGGHTALVIIESSGHAKIIGSTLDDAAGEAYDKAAKILDLGYPGGPIIDRLAAEGDPTAYSFPRGLTGGGGKPLQPENRYNFSFSGLKTALLYAVRDRSLSDRELRDVVASYQQAIVDVLVRKTSWAVTEMGCPAVCLCGGVACNSQLRREMTDAMTELGVEFVVAEPRYCTDNAAMVAGLAYHYAILEEHSGLDVSISARLNYELGSVPFAPGSVGAVTISG